MADILALSFGYKAKSNKNDYAIIPLRVFKKYELLKQYVIIETI